MDRIVKGLCTVALLGLALSIPAPKPAMALSAELAKKCLDMSYKVYPPKRTGVKHGNSAEQRKYYEDCLAHDGSMPATDNEQAAPAAAMPKAK
jgi:hypothetical protein